MTEQELYDQLSREYDRVIADTYHRLSRYKPLNKKKMLEELFKANKAYWVARVARLDEYFTASAEEAAAILAVPYAAAGMELSERVRSIYGTYSGIFGLNKAEVDNLLDTVVYDKPIMQQLQQIADAMPEGEEKTRILAEISAPAYRFRMQQTEATAESAKQITESIARNEIATERTFLQTTAEQSYNITLEELTGKTPASAIIDDIKSAAAAEEPLYTPQPPTTPAGVSDFVQTDNKGIAASFSTVSESHAREIINHNWSGKSFSLRIWSNTDEVARAVKETLLKGELSGMSGADMAEEISNRFNVGMYEARRLIRTESNYAANQANLRGIRDAGIEKYQYSAYIDKWTSEICHELNEEIFLVKDAKVGVNCPPMHPFCRSVVVAVQQTAEDIEQEIDDMLDALPVPEGVDVWDWLEDKMAEKIKNREA